MSSLSLHDGQVFVLSIVITLLIVLYCIILCYTVLHCVILCYSVILCYTVLYCATLRYTVLYYATLCYIVVVELVHRNSKSHKYIHACVMCNLYMYMLPGIICTIDVTCNICIIKDSFSNYMHTIFSVWSTVVVYFL